MEYLKKQPMKTTSSKMKTFSQMNQMNRSMIYSQEKTSKMKHSMNTLKMKKEKIL